MKNSDLFVSIVCPVFNQCNVIEGFVAEMEAVLAATAGYYEIIFVDNGSDDATRVGMEGLLKKRPGIRYIRLTRRFNTEAAIAAGLDHAIGDVVVVMAPGFDPPSRVMGLVEEVRKTGDILIGNLVSEIAVPWRKRAADRIVTWTLSRLLHFPLAHRTTYFLAFNRNSLNLLNAFQDRVRFIKAFAGLAGVPVRFFDYSPAQRGVLLESRARDQLRGMIDLVVSNSITPLRVATFGGLSISFMNLLYIGYVLGIALFKKHVAEGWVTLSLQTAGSFFVLSLVLVVVGEYMGALLMDSKRRPPYFVLEDKYSAVMIERESQRRNIVNMSVSGD